jgi:DNA-binding response OmpR family regulator
VRTPTVLVVEDDAKSRETLRLYVEHAGWRAVTAADGEEGLRLARAERPDVILLDLMLPRLDGRAVCAALRRESDDVAVIMVTARAAEEDRLRGLDEGADDYVTKPFSPREVVARVRALLRRTGAAPRERVTHLRGGAVRLEPAGRRLFVGGEEVRLTPTEWRILQLLSEKPGRVWSRDDLLERALGGDSSAGPRTVDAHIRNLRRKVDLDRERPLIVTVFGAGYRLEP